MIAVFILYTEVVVVAVVVVVGAHHVGGVGHVEEVVWAEASHLLLETVVCVDRVGAHVRLVSPHSHL